MIFINFKTYEQGTGQKAVDLVHKLCDCQKDSGVPVIPVVQAVDARICVEASDHEARLDSARQVWVQHTDGVEYGQYTGWILPEAVAQAGIKGTFLNHSEHKLTDGQLQMANGRCQEAGLKTLVFASDVSELKLVLELKPAYVAYEPLEFIASLTTSVARAKPEIVREAVKVVSAAQVPLIVGAGVKNVEDVRKSLELGAVGVVVSSAVVLAQDPKAKVLELAGGFK